MPASSLRQLAEFADIRGATAEAAAWRRLAADVERGGTAEIARLKALASSSDPSALHLPPGLHFQVRELLVGDPDTALQSAATLLPALLRNLLETGMVDAEGASALARLGIVTLADLQAAANDGRLARHMPQAAGRLSGMADLMASESAGMPLGRAVDLTENCVALLATVNPAPLDLTPADGVRRFEPLVQALTIVGSAADPGATLEAICALPVLQPIRHRTMRRALVTYQRSEVDIRIGAPDEFGTLLFTATGSDAHVAALRTRHATARLAAREEDVYAHAGLAFVPPELRHATGEIEAAASGSLPALVTREDIRGDLHIHTTYSDGADSLVEMVQAAYALGYEYIAITDHSERAGASRTLAKAHVGRQADEIERLRERYPRMAILHGVEVDIMPDGSLDFPDDVLARFDIVLASLHDRAGHDDDRLTRRCLAAIAHPLVNVITHPANRLVGRSPGYALDFPTVYAAAAESGTALEIDGAPSHLDMDGEHARAAVAAGVTVTIDSDCHRARLLDRQMRLGVGTARRGWVEARHVLNTRPLADVRAFFARKRSRA